MSVHLHTTIKRKTNELLEELTKTYGAKNRVLEQAIETLLRVEKVGSCEDCAIKARIDEQEKLKEALDLTSLQKKTLDGLLEVAIGDKTIDDFVKAQRIEARNTVEIMKSTLEWKAPRNFKEFKLILEEIENLTCIFDVSSYSEIDNTVILRPKVFKRLPEIVAFQTAVILEGAEAPFDIRMMGEDIAVKMIRREIYPLRKKEYGEFLEQEIEKRLSSSRPGLFKNSLMLVGPGFMGWAEKHLEEPITELASVIKDVKLALDVDELPTEPREFVKGVLSAGIKMNWFKEARISEENGEDTLDLTFQTTTPSVTRLSVAAYSVIFAVRGWKLLDYSVEYATGNMTIKYVGADDQSLNDQIVEMSLFQTIGRQFLDVIPVPREVFSSFALRMYKTDRQKFDEIYDSMGRRIAKAIRMLAKGDIDRVRKLSEIFILKNIAAIQPDAEVRFVDDEHFTIIFKRINPLMIRSQRELIESMFKELGYEVTTSTFQNLLSTKLKALEKPFLEPIPRKKLMQALINEMSAESAEEAFAKEKEILDELFPDEHPWTIREVGDRLIDMYRELDIEVEIEYFEGGFTLKYKTCPYYKLVKSGQKTWLCNVRKKTIEHIISRVSHGKKGKIKIIKSLLQNEHPCEYAIFLTGFLEDE